MAGSAQQRQAQNVARLHTVRTDLCFKITGGGGIVHADEYCGYSIKNGVPLPQSVMPLFGDPEGYFYDNSGGVEGIVRGPQRGDMAAKAEARRMIEESKVEELVPVSFTQDGGVTKEAEKQLL